MSTLALHSALYKEHQGTDYLSRTFQSSELHTPKDTDRGTIDEDCYQRQRNKTPVVPKTPWGRSFSYGGLGPLNLPADHKSKWEPPPRVQKGHKHFGSGVSPHPRGITIQQQYYMSPFQRSTCRSTDELVPPPTRENLGKFQVTQEFPAEHPYTSHISKFSVFPNFDSPDDLSRGRPAIQSQSTLPATAKASAPDPTIIGKTKGTPARHERVPAVSSSAKRPYTWHEGPNYFQLLKGPDRTRQIYYPTPPSTATPNMASRSLDISITPNTAIALDSLIKSHWTTSYQSAYSRSAPVRKPVSESNSGTEPLAENGSTTLASTFSSRPLQGRNRPPLSRSLPSSRDEETETGNSGNFNRSHSDASLDSVRSARSVQFNGSVRFSDGNNIKEIPLNANANGYSVANGVAKTPYPGKRSSFRNSSFRSKTVNYPSFSMNTMPSQSVNSYLTGSTDSGLEQRKISSLGVSTGGQNEGETLLELQRGWSKSAAHRNFRENHPESTPDLRRKPDLRITTNERRHVIPEAQAHAYRLH